VGRTRDGEWSMICKALGYWSPLQRSRDRSHGLKGITCAFVRTIDDLTQPAKPDQVVSRRSDSRRGDERRLVSDVVCVDAWRWRRIWWRTVETRIGAERVKRDLVLRNRRWPRTASDPADVGLPQDEKARVGETLKPNVRLG